MLELLKRNITAGKFIGSGLLKTVAQTISGFVILRWLVPEELGQWQSFTVFVGYIQILTLGVTSGLNRELPYWLGKGNMELGMDRLKTAGYFITLLSLILMTIFLLLGLALYILDIFSLDKTIMLIFAFSIGALSIQTNFLGASYRSSGSFGKLSRIQLYNSLLYFILIPLIYFFGLWGYIVYQIILAVFLYIGYNHFRPYKIKYKFDYSHFKILVSVGLPMYIWNFLASFTRTIPQLILVLFGSPLLVGLYAPASSINTAMLSLPEYTNRYLFPQMAFKFGKSSDVREVYNYSIKASILLFIIMIFGASVLAFIIPYIFPIFFPKYVEGITVAQIIVFSGVFYSINALYHNTLYSIKVFKPFKFIVSFRILYIALFTAITYYFLKDLLLAVALGSLLSEIFNLVNYIYFLRKATQEI